MAQPAIRVEGLAKLDRELKAAGDAVSDGARSELKAIHKDAANDIKDAAAARVPVRTGRLRASIRAAATARAGTVRAGFKSVPYAGPIHFGWPKHNITPQPFLYDALDARKDEVERAYRARVDQVMQRTFPDRGV